MPWYVHAMVALFAWGFTSLFYGLFKALEGLEKRTLNPNPVGHENGFRILLDYTLSKAFLLFLSPVTYPVFSLLTRKNRTRGEKGTVTSEEVMLQLLASLGTACLVIELGDIVLSYWGLGSGLTFGQWLRELRYEFVHG